MRILFLFHSNLRSGGNLAMMRHADLLMRRGVEVVFAFQEPFFPLALDHVGFAAPPRALMLPALRAQPAAPFDWALTNWWECAYRFSSVPARRYGYFRRDLEERFYDPYGRHFDLAIEAVWREPALEIFVVAPHLADEPASWGRRTALIPNGVDHALFARAAPSLPPKTAALRVLVEGPLEAPRKRIRETLALLARLDGVEAVHCAADGSAPAGQGAHLKLPALDPAGLAGVMASCDILVKLSSMEALPNPVFEMAAAGRPSVVAAFPGARQLFADGENALIVPVESVDAAGAAVARLRDDPALRARLGEAARALAARYNWEAASAAFYDRLSAYAAPADAPPATTALLDRFAPCYRAILDLWAKDRARQGA